MTPYFFTLEIIGTIAFAISGALVALKKEMDLFGVCILGIITACGGGLLRDLFLGTLPPTLFKEPVFALTATGVSLLIFLSFVRKILNYKEKIYEVILLISDSLGLGIFTAAGVSASIHAGYGDSLFFCVFLGSITGVGGGLIRDIMAGDPPYIFIKHIYACASLIGAILCALLFRVLGSSGAMLVCVASVFIIRILAAHFHWSLPKAKGI